ncbi:phosphoglycolate phosphatase [Vulcanisaeta thermophila]|uniref:phosphoglycolate phosphatase n=1 Tax=Vulcanisaeta thermophila TaxID=867917 RepID=UPI001EE311BE|nr:phosphoglycolate phosphatase [Vulcanisaeta thermophila]
MRIRPSLILLDVDGTLTRDRSTEALDPEALEAVQEAAVKYKMGIVTGNALIVAQALRRYIGLPRGSPVIAENGCLIDYEGNVEELCEDLGLKGVAYELMKYIPGLRPTYQFNYRKFDITLWYPGDANELISKVVSKLSEMGLKDKVRVSHSGYALHLQPMGSSKAIAIKHLCSLMGINCGDVVYIGDSDTDLEVMDVVGWGVAVGNAVEELRRRARIVLRNPSGKGVAEFVREYLE